MSDFVEVKITGLDVLQKALEQLPKKAGNKVIRDTLRESGQLVIDAAVARSPVIENPLPRAPKGFLKEHFAMQTKISRQDISASVRIGAAPGDYPLADGSLKEKINKKGGKYLVGSIAIATVLRWFEYGSIKIKKQPFFSQSWESVKDSVLAKFIADLKTALGL